MNNSGPTNLQADRAAESGFAAALQIREYREVLHCWEAIRTRLREAGCRFTDQEVSDNLLWISDLQLQVGPEHHEAICEDWNRYWIALWHLRSICPHAQFVTKPYLHNLPHHFACEVCGLVRVQNSDTALPRAAQNGQARR
jgi:hypothetical protein